MKSKKNIFIGGVTGFLASHLSEALVNLGHNVYGCDNLLGSSLDNLQDGVKFTKADCCNFQKMKSFTKDMDIVYITQASAYEGLSVFSPSVVSRNTYQSNITLLSAAISNNVDKIVFTSSMSRYGDNDVPFTEDMPTNPLDPYAVCKVAVEQQVKLLCDTHDIDWNIVVPHNIIGPRQHIDPYRNVAAIFINRIMLGKQPIIYGDGEQKRCFSFVGDCVKPLVEVALNPNIKNEIINIGPDDEFITINLLAKVIADELDWELHPIYLPDRPLEVKKANCSADKARVILGYSPKTSLKEGIKEMIESIEPRPFDYHLPVEIINEKTPETWSKRTM